MADIWAKMSDGSYTQMTMPEYLARSCWNSYDSPNYTEEQHEIMRKQAIEQDKKDFWPVIMPIVGIFFLFFIVLPVIGIIYLVDWANGPPQFENHNTYTNPNYEFLKEDAEIKAEAWELENGYTSISDKSKKEDDGFNRQKRKYLPIFAKSTARPLQYTQSEIDYFIYHISLKTGIPQGVFRTFYKAESNYGADYGKYSLTNAVFDDYHLKKQEFQCAIALLKHWKSHPAKLQNIPSSDKGKIGLLQFYPCDWYNYGLDANNDGFTYPWDAADAFYTLAFFLKTNGYEKKPQWAILARDGEYQMHVNDRPENYKYYRYIMRVGKKYGWM